MPHDTQTVRPDPGSKPANRGLGFPEAHGEPVLPRREEEADPLRREARRPYVARVDHAKYLGQT